MRRLHQSLSRFSFTQISFPCGIDAECHLADADLVVRFAIQGEIDSLRMPSESIRPQFRDGLWQHSCLECFLADSQSTAYLELNFSPSGDWAAYRFHRYRELDAALNSVSIRITCRRTAAGFVLEARVGLDSLPPLPEDRNLLIGLSAVLEHEPAETDGALSYWALCHPSDKPDFHDRRGFVEFSEHC